MRLALKRAARTFACWALTAAPRPALQVENICRERALKAFGLNPEQWGVNVQVRRRISPAAIASACDSAAPSLLAPARLLLRISVHRTVRRATQLQRLRWDAAGALQGVVRADKCRTLLLPPALLCRAAILRLARKLRRLHRVAAAARPHHGASRRRRRQAAAKRRFKP